MTWSKPIADWAQRTFGPGSPYRMFQRTQEEFDELRDVMDRGYINTGKDDLRSCDYQEAAEEAADVVITLIVFCDKMGIDLAEVVEKKHQKNLARKWHAFGDGCGAHVKGT